jgi:hypothetical protein
VLALKVGKGSDLPGVNARKQRIERGVVTNIRDARVVE